MDTTDRRSFLKQSAVAMAGAGLYASMPLSYTSCAPSDRVNVGAIGLGFGATNMRFAMEANPFVHCTALCDVDQIKLETRAAKLKEKFPVQASNIKFYFSGKYRLIG